MRSIPRRRAALTLVLAVALYSAFLNPHFASAEELPTVPAEFEFAGSGYGHGVGMSQIGARGQALEGKSAVDILKYYYPGADVTPYPDDALIRVNIANLISAATLTVPLNKSDKPGIRLYQGDIPLTENPEPFGVYQSDITAQFGNFAGFIVPTLSSPTAKFAAFPAAKAWTVRWDSPTVVALTNGGTTAQYRYGQIVFKSIVTPVTSYLAVTTTLRLHDEYLWGLGEVPSSWPPAALEAQAIAARTYALLKLNRLRAECDCNIYNTTVDQNFVGYAKEIEKIYGVRWKAAVNRTFVDSATALTVTMNGLPINAFYFSSSGGATQNIKDVWGSEFSYLQGVPDTWSTSMTLNPRYAAWVRRVPQEVMAKTFALPDVISYSIDSRTVTGSVSSITALSSNGKKATLTGEIFRAGVKLPSTWFDDSIRSFWVQKFRDECLQVSLRRNLICLM
ncbi:MAG: hypothetical protein RLZZ317_921 [Actinomycetota bacterium]